MRLRIEDTIRRKKILLTGYFADLQNISFQLDRKSLSKAIRVTEVEKEITLKSGMHKETCLKHSAYCIAKSKVKSNIPSIKSLGQISGMFNMKLSELIKLGEDIYEQNKEEQNKEEQNKEEQKITDKNHYCY